MPSFAAISEAAISDLPPVSCFLLGEASEIVDYDYKICVANEEFITSASDTPARQPFNDRLGGDGAQIMSFQRTLLGGTFLNSFAQGSGQMQLVNADGGYDFLPNQYAVDGRPVEVRVGRRGVDSYSASVPVFKGTAANWSVEEDFVEVDIEDFTYKLDTPLQSSLYGGTGGADGGADLAGKRIPSAYGSNLNVTPAFLVPSLLIYQVHDGAVNAISAVYDKGAALSAGSDYATYALLAAATVAEGGFATSLALGLFRLGSTPAGQVTCDVEGDASGSGYVSTTGTIARRIISTRSTLVDPDDLYLPAFNALETAQGSAVGIYAGPDDNSTILDALSRLIGVVGGAFWFRRDGKLAVGIFKSPEGEIPVAKFSTLDVISPPGVKRERLPDSVEPPPWRWRVGYQRNETVQSATDIASGVTATRLAFVAEQYRIASSSNAAILVDHPRANDPDPVQAYFANEADAQAEADRLLTLHRDTRAIYRFSIPAIPGEGYKLDLNDVIELTYPRWDLVNGRNLRVLGLTDDASANTIEIVAFG